MKSTPFQPKHHIHSAWNCVGAFSKCHSSRIKLTDVAGSWFKAHISHEGLGIVAQGTDLCAIYGDREPVELPFIISKVECGIHL